ncbi:KIAA0930 family protein [Megaselia abdita]
MALGAVGTNFLKKQSPLQQLIDDINFQRAKSMRQLLKDDSGFVILQGTTYWTDLFVRHFLFQSEQQHNIDSDDLLFFVRRKVTKGSSRNATPKLETEVDVFRKDSRKLPIGDPDVNWEETVYLNMIIHEFTYTLTLAICTRTSPKELQVLKRHSQRVYASPSRRKMNTKGESEEMTYPHICFMVDNFDEVFCDILVRDGEMVCVELVASDKDGSVQGVIFLGSIRYDALKKVYDARQSSLSTKVAQRMTFGLFSSGANVQTRCEFVRMKGPQGKGHAEMAVTKPKGSGVETPTSEPGFCATDLWDEWDEDPDDFYTYRHQRRLSDPSANLNDYTRYGWKTKMSEPTAANKARSENEGLDSIANEVSEIEAGDLTDDRRLASSASQNHVHTSSSQIQSPTATCCNCFGSKKCRRRRWSNITSAQMSEVYCRACSTEEDTPDCLNYVPAKNDKPKHKTILNVESQLESKGKDVKTSNNKNNNDRESNREYEIADEAVDDDIAVKTDSKFGVLSESDTKVTVHGKEELPMRSFKKSISVPLATKSHPLNSDDEESKPMLTHHVDDCNGNFRNHLQNHKKCLTLPRPMKKCLSVHENSFRKALRLVPKQETPDGTTIFYWCDLSKKMKKGGRGVLKSLSFL